MFASIVTGFFAEDDIKLNNQMFNWPGRMDPIFEVGQQRLTSRREKAENEIKERHVTQQGRVGRIFPACSRCFYLVQEDKV